LRQRLTQAGGETLRRVIHADGTGLRIAVPQVMLVISRKTPRRVIGRAGVLSPDVQVIMSSADVAAMQAPHARGGGWGAARWQAGGRALPMREGAAQAAGLKMLLDIGVLTMIVRRMGGRRGRARKPAHGAFFSGPARRPCAAPRRRGRRASQTTACESRADRASPIGGRDQGHGA
jgi:hypothetical protein